MNDNNQIHWARHSGKQCEECLAGFPTLCNCGGNIHAEHVLKDEKKGLTEIKYNCDKCGSKFMRARSFRGRRNAYNNTRNNKPHEHARGPNTRV